MPDENHTNEIPKDESADWRTGLYPSDLLFSRDSQYSYESFEGRAVIYESADSATPLKIDLFIRNIEMRLEEHIQVTEHIGDTFGITCFGKAPMRVIFSAVLADTQKTYGKMYLIDAYKNKLRLGAVARRGKIPVLNFGAYALQGPLISMQINENSDSEDTIMVVFTMLLTGLQVVGSGEPLVFDYVHGIEKENPDEFISNPYSFEVEEKNETPEEPLVGPPKPPHLTNVQPQSGPSAIQPVPIYRPNP